MDSVVQDGYMRFVTTSERSELRCPQNDDQSDGFTVSNARAFFTGTVRLGNPSIGESEDYTWMQVNLPYPCTL